MSTSDEILTGKPVVSNAAEPLSLRAMRNVAAILLGITAFFLNLQPVWSINASSAAWASICRSRRRLNVFSASGRVDS